MKVRAGAGGNDLNGLIDRLMNCENLTDYDNVAKERPYNQFAKSLNNAKAAAEEVINQLRPEAQSFIWSYILGAQTRGDGQVDKNWVTHARMMVLHRMPLACCVEAYADVFRGFIMYHRKTSETGIGDLLPQILASVKHLQQGKNYILTSAHCELLHTIWMELDWDTWDWHHELVELQNGINLVEFLRYNYYAGTIHLLHKRYSQAIAALSNVLNVPSDPNASSQIVLDALKKYKIACLIYHGKAIPVVGSRLNGYMVSEYTDLEEAFAQSVTGSIETLNACLAKHIDAWKADKNHGLVQRIRFAVWRQRLHQLRKVYLASPLSRITEVVLGPQRQNEETMELLTEMAKEQEIAIKVEPRGKEQIIRFVDGGDLRAEKAERIRKKVEVLSRRMLMISRKNELAAAS